MDTKSAFEGWLVFQRDDGREFRELVFGAEHAKRCIEAWQAGECPGRFQTAAGDWSDCARPVGHAGHCAHRKQEGD